MAERRGRGRPSTYRPLLNRITDAEWHLMRLGHKNHTAVSALRYRYPGFDFRAVPDGTGTYTIEARRLEK